MLCNYFKYDKFTVIAGQDFFGSKGAIEISDDTYCGIKPMSVHLATTDGDNINEIVNEAKVFGARIFAILVGSGYEKTAARLIEEGAAKGLFGMDTQIFLPHQLIDGQFWKFFSNDADVPLLMKGLISLRYDPLDMVRRSETGMQFIERWRAQQSSQWEVDGSTECLQTRDDDDQYYLYRSEGDTAFTGYTCAGLNYSNFLSDASNVAPYIGHAYDSANVLLLGIDAAITQYGNNFTGDDLMQAIFDIAEFDGATGVVDVFEGMKQFSGYGQGNREVGQIFYALNFDKSMYVMNGPDGDFMVPVLLWTAEAGAELIHAITFHSSDGQMVPDRLPSTVREDNFESKRIILVVMACLCFFSSGFYILMYALNWKSKYVTSSQPRMSLLILLGGILVGGRVLNAAMRITDATCIAGLWLGHLGFCLVFCALFIKMWRVSALINAGLKKIRISEWFVVQLTLAAFACMAVYMCILTWVGLPHASHQCTTEHNEMTCLMQCSFKHAEVHTALFFIEGAMVLYGAYLCYRIKGAPAAVNDSKYNAQGIILTCTSSSIVHFSRPIHQRFWRWQ